MHFFTSVNINYLPKARILAKTLKQHNKDAVFYLGLLDDLPDTVKLEDEPFDHVIFTDKLPAIKNPECFFFKYNITEACTAVKPATALYIMEEYNADKVCYLDPDIAVFSQLTEVATLLNKYSMVFTPHTTIPEEADNLIVGNEVLFLKRGTNNLGFFAVKNDDEGKSFLKWWDKRLQFFCLDDEDTLRDLLNEQTLLGLFTDQKWIDMVPSFFDNYYLLKHPGYNVSTWNLSHREIKKKEDGNIYVNNLPLRFFHFSGVDSGAHMAVLQQLNILYPHTRECLQLSNWYMKQQEQAGQNKWKSVEWKYSRYSDGRLVPRIHRKILAIRRDAWRYFPNPFQITDSFCFYNWMIGEYGEYLQSINGQAEQLRRNSTPNKFVLFAQKMLLLFIRPDSKLYLKIKRVYKVLRS